MKKIVGKSLSSICFMLFLTLPAFSVCNYQEQCAPIPPAGIGTFLSNATGSTYLSEQLTQAVMKAELKKATGQDFEVSLDALSAGDLLNGKFKSLTITGNNLVFEGFYITSLKLQTLCEFNSVDAMAKPMKIRENLVLGVSAEISDTDLRKSMVEGQYAKKISHANLSEIGIASYNIYGPTVSVKDNKLYFTASATPFATQRPMDIATSADIKVQNGRVISSKIEFINLYAGFDLSQFAEVAKRLDNLNFPIKIPGNEKSQFQLMNIEVVGDKINIYGVVFIPKN